MAIANGELEKKRLIFSRCAIWIYFSLTWTRIFITGFLFFLGAWALQSSIFRWRVIAFAGSFSDTTTTCLGTVGPFLPVWPLTINYEENHGHFKYKRPFLFLQSWIKLVETNEYHTLFANHLTNERVETLLSPSPPVQCCFIGLPILGFHVTSSNSKLQNREAYRIFTFIQGNIT